jgi:hypothetical protein
MKPGSPEVLRVTGPAPGAPCALSPAIYLRNKLSLTPRFQAF